MLFLITRGIRMRKAFSLAGACAVVFCGLGGQACAALITNGSLAVTIRDDNGAINDATLDGVEYFRLGAFVSDYGFQNGTNTSTFVLNNANGSEGQPANVTGATASGTFTGGGAMVAFQRSYSLISGLNVLRITTTLTNTGSDVTLSYFDTFDPDQSDFSTSNDVTTLGGGLAGQSIGSSGYTLIVGSVDDRVTVASGGPFNIGDGFTLNNFFNAPIDGNGVVADSGTHIGIRTLISAGQSTSFIVDLAFGATQGDAQNAFIQANAPAAPAAVPEPTSLALWGLGAIGLSLGAARRRLRNRRRVES